MIAPADSSAATASRTRASTPGSMPLTKYWRGRPIRAPRSQPAASSSLAASSLDQSGTGIGAEVESRSSRPAIAWRSVAASRGSRPKGPIWSSELAQGVVPERGGGAAGGAPEGPDGGERAGEGDDAVAADAAVGRLEAAHTTERGGLADRAARVRADAQRHVVRSHGRRRAAATAARDPREVPGVARRTPGRVLGRGAHGELVHVRLAGHDRAGLGEPLRDIGVIGADEATEDATAGGRGKPPCHHDVLPPHPHPQ